MNEKNPQKIGDPWKLMISP